MSDDASTTANTVLTHLSEDHLGYIEDAANLRSKRDDLLPSRGYITIYNCD